MFTLFFKLLCGHALGDFALQNDFIATYKSRHMKLGSDTIWPYILGSHCLIQGLMVYLALGSLALALCETATHFIIDFAKCEKIFGFHIDQGLHVVCKVLWLALFMHGFK